MIKTLNFGQCFGQLVELMLQIRLSGINSITALQPKLQFQQNELFSKSQISKLKEKISKHYDQQQQNTLILDFFLQSEEQQNNLLVEQFQLQPTIFNKSEKQNSLDLELKTLQRSIISVLVNSPVIHALQIYQKYKLLYNISFQQIFRQTLLKVETIKNQGFLKVQYGILSNLNEIIQQQHPNQFQIISSQEKEFTIPQITNNKNLKLYSNNNINRDRYKSEDQISQLNTQESSSGLNIREKKASSSNIARSGSLHSAYSTQDGFVFMATLEELSIQIQDQDGCNLILEEQDYDSQMEDGQSNFQQSLDKINDFEFLVNNSLDQAILNVTDLKNKIENSLNNQSEKSSQKKLISAIDDILELHDYFSKFTSSIY